MISDDSVKKLFRKCERILAGNRTPGKSLQTEFFRGVKIREGNNQHRGGCARHLAIFDKYNVIPRHCFSCYKVQIEPRTVMELFKLMMIFHEIRLPDDNTRKCTVECREQVAGTYKGLVYCRSMEEGNRISDVIRAIVDGEISRDIPVILRHGCSEYSLAYPEFSRIGNTGSEMTYRPEWEELESRCDRELGSTIRPVGSGTNNSPGYTLRDARAMLAWLKYAATIGDNSYLAVAGRPVHPVPGLDRPPFQPPGE